MSTPDPVDPSTPNSAFPSIALPFKHTVSTPRTLSVSSAIPFAPKEQQQHSEIVSVSPPSTFWPESLENRISISQQLFQSPSRDGAPASSIVDIDGKDEYTLSSRLFAPIDEDCISKNNKEALNQKRPYK